MKSKTRDYVRKFNIGTNKMHYWICGCSETNRLYCVPCLFFGRKSNNIACVKNGINYLINLASKTKKRHEKSLAHINYKLNLKLLGKQNLRRNILVRISWIIIIQWQNYL